MVDYHDQYGKIKLKLGSNTETGRALENYAHRVMHLAPAAIKDTFQVQYPTWISDNGSVYVQTKIAYTNESSEGGYGRFKTLKVFDHGGQPTDIVTNHQAADEFARGREMHVIVKPYFWANTETKQAGIGLDVMQIKLKLKRVGRFTPQEPEAEAVELEGCAL